MSLESARLLLGFIDDSPAVAPRMIPLVVSELTTIGNNALHSNSAVGAEQAQVGYVRWKTMNSRIYLRRGLGEDWLSSHWFCDCLRTTRQLLAQAQVQDAEQLVAVASLYALERMETDALAEAMSALAEVLEAKGETLQDYFERGEKAVDQRFWGFDQAA